METAKGVAMNEQNGFAKVVLKRRRTNPGRNCSWLQASELVQQVVYLMNTEYETSCQ